LKNQKYKSLIASLKGVDIAKELESASLIAAPTGGEKSAPRGCTL